MGTTSAEVDADFLDLFDDFNEEDALDSVFISENLLEVSGMTAAPVVHAGEADEGQVNWVAPTHSGLQNSQKVLDGQGNWNRQEPPPKDSDADSEADLWDDSKGPQLALSANLLQDLDDEQQRLVAKAKQDVTPEYAAKAASAFERLAAHGRGTTRMSKEDFMGLMEELAADEANELLELRSMGIRATMAAREMVGMRGKAVVPKTSQRAIELEKKLMGTSDTAAERLMNKTFAGSAPAAAPKSPAPAMTMQQAKAMTLRGGWPVK